AVPPERGPIAILVAHGMGQQIPFETPDNLATGLLAADDRVRRQAKAAQRIHGSAGGDSVVRRVNLDGQMLPRVELSVGMPGGGRRNVHVYESYWAPLTEGQI